jgi:carbonic anhydrase
MSTTDELLQNAKVYREHFTKGDLPLPPARKVAVLACMDARLNPYGLLGLQEGDAHVIRNAGGVVTDDEIRSLAISQRLLGTEEVILIHHTDCGMLTFTDDEFKLRFRRTSGSSPNGPPKRSRTSTRTFASRSPGSRRVPSSRAKTGCAVLYTTSTPATCAKSSQHR